MKKFLFVLILFAATNAFAQFGVGVSGGHFGMRVPVNGKGERQSQNLENQVQRMKKDLNLDDKQTVQLRNLLIERERHSSQYKPMTVSEFNQRLEQILTPEQMKLLNEKNAQHQQKSKMKDAFKDSTKQASQPKKEDWSDDVYK